MKLPGTGDGSAPPSPIPMQRPPGRALSLLLSLFFPTSLLAFLLLLLAACNGFLCITTEAVSSSRPSPARFQIRDSLPESPVLAVKEEAPLRKAQTPQRSQLLQEGGGGPPHSNLSTAPRRKWSSRRAKALHRLLRPSDRAKQFASRADEFLNLSPQNSSEAPCKVRFFMTWISPLESFGERELFAVESLFKSHPDACLLILSNTMDSARGARLLRPFLQTGFRVSAMSPDYAYLFKNTPAEPWFQRLQKGGIDPGEVPLGQNLSNLLRLAALYKFGGVYIDTDVIVMKSFSCLRNAIGAQTLDLATGNWSRLNNAVMVFDTKHPLLYKFIQEFALTFDGNKWGHNGPYLVSRVAARVTGRPGFRFTVLPPSAFYPVDWSRIRGLFRGPRSETDSRWFSEKLWRIREGSFAVHLWNRQSRKIQVEKGSIIGRIMSECCIFCNTSMSSL